MQTMLLYLISISTAMAYPPQFAKEYLTSLHTTTQGPKPDTRIPTILSQQSLVKNLLSKIDPDLVRKHLVTLTEFPDRYYKGNSNDIPHVRWCSGCKLAFKGS